MPHTPADISQLIVDAVGLQDALFDANLTEARRRARRIHRVSTRLGYPVLIESSRNALCHLAETIRLTASIRTSVEALFLSLIKSAPVNLRFLLSHAGRCGTTRIGRETHASISSDA